MPRNPLVGMPLIRNSKRLGDLHHRRSPIIVASAFMKDVLLYNGFAADRISVLPYFTYLPEPEASGHGSKEPLVLALGRIVPEKGMHYLIKAFSRLRPPSKLTIVGDGPALPSLKNLAENLGISSRLLYSGWLSHDKLDALYRRSSMVVVPSVWPEPFGIVGIEAMAYGKPVIAFDVGGISEWLEDGKTGFIIKLRDEAALAEKLNLLLQNPNLALRMGTQARESVEKRFVPDIHVERLLSIFNKAVIAFHMKNDNP